MVSLSFIFCQPAGGFEKDRKKVGWVIVVGWLIDELVGWLVGSKNMKTFGWLIVVGWLID